MMDQRKGDGPGPRMVDVLGEENDGNLAMAWSLICAVNAGNPHFDADRFGPWQMLGMAIDYAMLHLARNLPEVAVGDDIRHNAEWLESDDCDLPDETRMWARMVTHRAREIHAEYHPELYDDNGT